MDPLGLTPDGKPCFPPGDAYYPLSFEKVLRMLERLRTNGFVCLPRCIACWWRPTSNLKPSGKSVACPDCVGQAVIWLAR